MNDPCHHPLNHGFDRFYGLPLTNLKDFGDNGDSVVTTYYPYALHLCYTLMAISASLTYLLVRRGRVVLASLVFVTFFVNPSLVILFVKSIHTIDGILMSDLDVVEQPVRLPGLTQRIVREAEGFVRSAAADRKPFLLFLSFVHVHTALFTHPAFMGTSNHGRYGDNVEELDWGVGRLLEVLEETGQTGNSFVYFTSDNGGHIQEVGLDGQREGGYNGVYRGGKTMGGWEGGIRVPTVVSWPGQVPAGHRVDVATSQMDMLPTVLHLAGLEPPKDRIIDGTSLLPLLRNETRSSPHEFLFHYCGTDVHAVRYIPRDGSGVWKVHFHSSDESQCPYVCHCYGSYVLHHDPPLVFHLDTDPSEKNPLSPSTDPRVHKVLAAARDALRGHEASLQSLPQQFNFINTFWLPWLQPCCNFPRCSCREEDSTLL